MTTGVKEIVSSGKTPLEVPEHDIQAVRTSIGSGQPVQPWSYLCKGKRVRIIRGPLAGLEGVLISVGDRYRVIISIEVLKRSVAAEVSLDWVEAVDSVVHLSSENA